MNISERKKFVEVSSSQSFFWMDKFKKYVDFCKIPCYNIVKQI